MKLITFQHKLVLDKIMNDNRYECDFVSKYHNDSPKLYGELSKRLNIEGIPVFCWYNVIGLPLEINLETVNRCIEMVGCLVKNYNDYYILELEVPDNKVDLQNFYSFASLKCMEMDNQMDIFNEALEMNSLDKFDPTKDEIQATIPYILKEWVKNIYSYKVELVREKIDTSIYSDYFKNILIKRGVDLDNYYGNFNRVTKIDKVGEI